MKIFFYLLLIASPLVGNAPSHEEATRRIQSHLLIKDVKNALKEAKQAHTFYPDSPSLFALYLKSLAAAKESRLLVEELAAYEKAFPTKAHDHFLLEELCWGILEKGIAASATTSRLIALIGAALTQDVRAVDALERGLKDSNAVVRTVCSELSGHFGDARLQKVLSNLLHKETKAKVRLSVIGAVGQLHMDEIAPHLLHILESNYRAPEEKIAALKALVQLKKSVSHQELEYLVNHKRAVLRGLAAELVATLSLEDEVYTISKLVTDSHPEVAALAIKAMGLLKKGEYPLFLTTTTSCDPQLAITAGWALLITGSEERGKAVLSEFIDHPMRKVRVLAAAALRASGPYGLELAQQLFSSSDDPFVRANLAIALLEQRVHVAKACAFLAEFFTSSKEQWMMGEAVGGLFTPLQPSELIHVPLVPNLPEATNQSVRLEILNLLAICGYEGVEETIKTFLKTSRWGISGIAAELLLQEGDESAIDSIRSLLDDEDEKVQFEAALALAIWGRDHSALPTLLRLYPKAEKTQKIKILEAVGRIGNHDAIPFLTKELANPSETLQVIAAAMLVMTLNH